MWIHNRDRNTLKLNRVLCVLMITRQIRQMHWPNMQWGIWWPAIVWIICGLGCCQAQNDSRLHLLCGSLHSWINRQTNSEHNSIDGTFNIAAKLCIYLIFCLSKFALNNEYVHTLHMQLLSGFWTPQITDEIAIH